MPAATEMTGSRLQNSGARWIFRKKHRRCDSECDRPRVKNHSRHEMVRSRANARPHRKWGRWPLPGHPARWVHAGGIISTSHEARLKCAPLVDRPPGHRRELLHQTVRHLPGHRQLAVTLEFRDRGLGVGADGAGRLQLAVAIFGERALDAGDTAPAAGAMCDRPRCGPGSTPADARVRRRGASRAQAGAVDFATRLVMGSAWARRPGIDGLYLDRLVGSGGASGSITASQPRPGAGAAADWQARAPASQ